MMAYTERGANACVARPIVEEGEEDSGMWAGGMSITSLDYAPWEVLWNSAPSKAGRNALVAFTGANVHEHFSGNSSRRDRGVCRKRAHRARLMISTHEADSALD